MADQPVLLSGDALSIDDLVEVARRRRPVALAPGAEERIADAWAVTEEWLAGGAAAYGFTSGVGALTDRRPPTDRKDRVLFNDVVVAQHRVGSGPLLPEDVARATVVVLVNGLARGFSAVRPVTVARLLAALDAPALPPVRSRGSVGQGDLAPLADLAAGVLGAGHLEAGEGLALLGGNAMATAAAALALHDAMTVLAWAQQTVALSMEGIAANLSVLDPVIAAAQPTAGVLAVREELARLLDGSSLWAPGAARRLQDPLTFRTVPQLHGAAHDALAHVAVVVSAAANASQVNPLVDRVGRRLVSAGPFDGSALVHALDAGRLAVAMVVTASVERSIKLLQAAHTGLPQGLTPPGAHAAEDGLAEFGVSVQAFAAEVRLLAAPVALELSSTSQAAGVEDRTTLVALAAGRMAEQVALARLVLAVELVVAAQAVDLRMPVALGAGTAEIHRTVRAMAPALAPGGPIPDLEAVVERMAGRPGAGVP